jgi:hypothetical protein
MGKIVHIDDDVLQAAEKIAAERGVTVDQVVSDLARRGLGHRQMRPLIERNGFLVLPHRGGVVTPELIRELEEQADLEDAGMLPKD